MMMMKDARMFGISSASYSEYHYFTRLQYLKHPNSTKNIFLTLEAVIACNACKKLDLASFCKHHESMIPSWISKEGKELNRIIYNYLGADKAAEREIANVQGSRIGQAFPISAVNTFNNKKFYTPQGDWDKPDVIFLCVDPNAGGTCNMAIVSLIRTRAHLWVVCYFFLFFLIYFHVLSAEYTRYKILERSCKFSSMMLSMIVGHVSKICS